MVCHTSDLANSTEDSRFNVLLQRALRNMNRSLTINEFVARELHSDQEIRQMSRLLEEDREHCACLQALQAGENGSEMTETVPHEVLLTRLEGLRRAIDEELQSVSFCLELAELAGEKLKDTFRKLAMAQQQHAVWLLYFYTMNKK